MAPLSLGPSSASSPCSTRPPSPPPRRPHPGAPYPRSAAKSQASTPAPRPSAPPVDARLETKSLSLTKFNRTTGKFTRGNLASLIVPRARRAHVIIGTCRLPAASSRRYRARAREGCDGRPRRERSRRGATQLRIGNFVLGVNVHERAPCRAAARITARTSTSR